MPKVKLIAQGGEGAATAELEEAVAGLDLEGVGVDPLPDGPQPAADRNQAILTATVPAGAADVPARFDLAREIASLTGWEVEPDLDSTLFRPWETREGDGGSRTDDVRWAVEAIGCPAAWDSSTGVGIKVGHPDTGYVDHPELEGAIGDGGYDVLDDDPEPKDVLKGVPPAQFPGHGTGTGSVIASPAMAQDDLAGAAPGASLIPFRVARTVILFRGSRLLRAIRLARNADCKVISISLGGIHLGSTLRREMEAAVAEGRIIVAAAGQPLPFVVEPASYESTIAAAGSTIEEKPWAWTARGKSVDICAPAAHVPRANAKTKLVAGGDGTSFATALTAGVAALWLGAHWDELKKEPAAVQPKFKSLVALSATRPEGWDEENFGAGILNAAALMELSPQDDAKPVERRVEPVRGQRIINWLSRLLETEAEPWLDASFDAPPAQTAERFGTELAYLAAEDEAARLELREAAIGATEPGPTATPARLVARGSRSLGEAIL